jgi:hypothetical protein
LGFNKFIKESGWGLLLIIPFLAIGILTLFLSIKNIHKTEQAEDWNQVPANIEGVDIESIKGSKGTKSYKVIAKYSYIIGSKKYFGDRIAFGYSMSNFEDNHGLFYKLKESKKIMIYVNPKNESESVIIPGMNGSIIFVLIFSTLWNCTLVGSVLSLCYERIKNYNGIFLFCVWVGGVFLLISGITNIDIVSKVKILEESNKVTIIELNINNNFLASGPLFR